MSHSRAYVGQIVQVMKNTQQAETWQKFSEVAEDFEKKNWDEARRLAKKHRCVVRECFRNCALIALKHPELTYVEGMACKLIPVQHAWLVNAEGEVIDPTYVLTEEYENTDYFGVRIPIETLIKPKLMERHAFLPAWLYVIQPELLDED